MNADQYLKAITNSERQIGLYSKRFNKPKRLLSGLRNSIKDLTQPPRQSNHRRRAWRS